MERYETEKLSKHQFASMKSWLELLHFMLFTLDILILNQTFGNNREIFRNLAVTQGKLLTGKLVTSISLVTVAVIAL